jgi:hypothetical protein
VGSSHEPTFACHPERSEGSSGAIAGGHTAGFFAKPQNDSQGNVHFTVPTDGLRWVGRLMMAARAVHLSAPLNGPVFFAASK